MKLIHTADLHLDACFAALGLPAAFGNRRRQSLRDVLGDIVARAAAWPADALLIAGDLYEQDRVTRDTVAFLRATFASIRPVPVIIAPGNHDPFMDDSPYAAERWPDNVHIFTRPEWDHVSLLDGRLVVHGFAFDGYEISTNPFSRIDVPNDGAVHVAVAHGTERAHQPPDGKSYAPFDAAEVARPNLKYLALGHFHAVTPIEDTGPTVMYYSGAPEAHGFNHPGMRHYLEVEIEDGAVQVRPAPSARVVYESFGLDCSAFEHAQQLIDTLREQAAQRSAPQIARVTLTGSCLPSLLAELPAVYDAVAAQFESLQLIDQTVPVEDYEDLARESTTLGAFVHRMNEEIADAPDEVRVRLLKRAREVGVAAYREQKLGIRGLDFGGASA